ncbi:hypothetical protein BEU23_27595 [Bacillus anthracis]|uniref:Uncharacterized protein n=1 Tax=Bacillus anthracis TaxID=1392 RepID=Q6F072_BACAN|nr:hypothetical protein BX_B0106 [Bacillus anthracis str. A2012]AAT35518.1 hypothetical protein GBAA_pXO2_0106 [Bacillus anthracis str. 'Ames Ancestor']APT29353.1 hypothetical protein BVB96_30485 [Bacillus anthracis]OPE85683.1 hypothetical protein BEU25_26700 [Bacillus anthracis]OPE88256.1 hypothetical protein BEU24_26495 [Bacillus anthracis]
MCLFLFIYIITEVKQKNNSAELLYTHYILLFNYHQLFFIFPSLVVASMQPFFLALFALVV